MKLLNLEQGIFFQMGDGKNWRVVHPDMGAQQITLNHGIHAPGQEFPQHIHDYSEDAIVCIEGGGSIRQGDSYTPIMAGETIFVPAGEVHGTKNTTDVPARMISFQGPPDMALYRGERDHKPGEAPTPQSGHISNVQVIDMSKSGPIFGQSYDWRRVISPEKGSKHLSLDYIQLNSGERFDHLPKDVESVYVLASGEIRVETSEDSHDLEFKDVIFVCPNDSFTVTHVGDEVAKLIYCQPVVALV